ncbi:MAG: response regulator, partial [Candidatus Aquilonibacter sp.]
MADTILIVEDEPQIGEVLAEYLRAEGFAAQVCTTVAEAGAALAGARPDLMLLDVTLPDGSGLDILRDVRDRG